MTMTTEQPPKGQSKIFNEHNLTEEDADLLFRYLLGEDINERLNVLYHGRGVPKLWGFRISLQTTFDHGTFVVSSIDQPRRTGNDENPLHPTVRKIKALCGGELAEKVICAARAEKVSNQAGFRSGILAALDRWAL